jgi:hypothetical protein
METFILVLNSVIYIALGFALIEVYLKVNKIWKRKHEKQVAESQSLLGLGLSLFILVVWSVKYLIEGDYESIADNGIYLIETSAMILIGTGLFVKENKGKNLFRLILQAIKLERKEASYLINSISGKKEAQEIINILHQLAWIDNELDKKEVELIKDFAKHWNINYNEKSNTVITIPKELTEKLSSIRNCFQKYLDTSPDIEQIAQLQDLMQNLINADDKVTNEEEIIFDEIKGMLSQYLHKNEQPKYYHVLIVPQEREHANIIHNLKPDAEEIHTAGGVAYSLEKYLSYKYADMMCENYRKNGLFTIVYELE